MPEPESPGSEPARVDDGGAGRVQCPNCCRLAFVTSRRMGLLFYRCELCETIGATPDLDAAGDPISSPPANPPSRVP